MNPGFARIYPQAVGQSFARGPTFKEAMVQRFEPVTKVEESAKAAKGIEANRPSRGLHPKVPGACSIGFLG